MDENAAKIAIGDEPVYTSYSAFTQWLRCGKAYQLSRLLEVRELPAWYFVGGSAFHTATELYDQARWEAERG